MNGIIEKYERFVTALLISLMTIVVTLSIGDLAWVLIKDIITPPILLLDIDELLDLFGLFLLVMIGIELLETLRSYVQKREIRTEVILLVALIALARKAITLDIEAVPSISLVGMAALIVALGVTYYLIKRTHTHADKLDPPEHSTRVHNLNRTVSKKDAHAP